MLVPLNHIQTLPSTKFLNGSQINVSHDEPACERMPQDVWCNVRQFSMLAGRFKGCSEAPVGLLPRPSFADRVSVAPVKNRSEPLSASIVPYVFIAVKITFAGPVNREMSKPALSLPPNSHLH